MPDDFPKAALDEATRLGRASGELSRSQVADCPYRHDVMPLRGAWISGFSAGRVLINAATARPPLLPR